MTSLGSLKTRATIHLLALQVLALVTQYQPQSIDFHRIVQFLKCGR